MAYKTWTFTANIGSTNTNENHVDYINEGSVVGSEDFILSGQKGTIDLVLHVNGTENQKNWKACTTVEMVLMSAPACYPRLSKYQQKRVSSEKITSRNTTDGGGSCTLTAENAFVLHAGNNLYIGAVGYDSTGAVVRTTNMQYACTIEQGADVEELTDGANMSLTAAETLKQQIAGKMDAAGYTDAVGEIPVVNAAGNLKVRPVEFAIDNNDNFVLRGTESQVIASIPKSQLDGAKGDKGEQGADGKSAYQYAQDGGYAGTEAEFAEKLAQEMPDTLPNPNALTFTGAVTGSYDGSAAVTVEIPAGGVGSYTLPIASPTTLGGVQPVAKTDEMTQAVGVDALGGLWALPGGGGSGSSEPEAIENSYWSGYKYADGRMTLKSVKKSSFMYGWTINKVTGVKVSSSTLRDSEVFPAGFIEPPTISLMHTAGTTDYTGIYLYTDYARCTADASDNTYKLPPEPRFCYTPSADATGGMNNGTFYLIAEGRWK